MLGSARMLGSGAEQKGRKFGSEARDRLLSLSVFFYRLLSWIVCVLLFAFTGFFQVEKAGRRYD